MSCNPLQDKSLTKSFLRQRLEEVPHQIRRVLPSESRGRWNRNQAVRAACFEGLSNVVSSQEGRRRQYDDNLLVSGYLFLTGWISCGTIQPISLAIRSKGAGTSAWNPGCIPHYLTCFSLLQMTNEVGKAMFGKAGELGVPVGFMCMKVWILPTNDYLCCFIKLRFCLATTFLDVPCWFRALACTSLRSRNYARNFLQPRCYSITWPSASHLREYSFSSIMTIDPCTKG